MLLGPVWAGHAGAPVPDTPLRLAKARAGQPAAVAAAATETGVETDAGAADDTRLLRVQQLSALWGQQEAVLPDSVDTARAWLTLLGLDPARVAEAYRRFGMAAYDRSELEASVKLLSVAHAFYPDDVEIAGRLGFAYKETGAYERAVGVLLVALNLDHENYYHWWWLSDAQRMLGDYAGSVETILEAQATAPESERQNLQNYVDFTRELADETQSWTNAERHMGLADRHGKGHRIRRQIAELMTALSLLPEQEETFDSLARRAWLNQQIGTQHSYIKEPDVALDYFRRALHLYAAADSAPDVMRNHQNIAVACEQLAQRQPIHRDAFLESALAHWDKAIELAEAANDIAYGRFARGGRLGVLLKHSGIDSPEVAAAREALKPEIPWQGPVSEYSTAEVLMGELDCRLAEGDIAGARILIEMVLPYYNDSAYLVDSERTAQLQVLLARVYQEQGHYTKAMESAALAIHKLMSVRRFVDSDAYNRDVNDATYRHISAALVRATLALDDPARAVKVFEGQRAKARLDLLGTKIQDEAQTVDRATESEIIRRRLPLLEAELAKARAENDPIETARLERRLAQDRARAAWLARNIEFSHPRLFGFKEIPLRTAEEIQKGLEAETALIHYVTDAWGGCAVVITKDAIEGVLLEEADEASVRSLLAALSEAEGKGEAAPSTEMLHAMLFEPLRASLNAKHLVIAPDEVLASLPFEALGKGGDSVAETFGVSYANSGSYLLHAMDMAGDASNTLRAVLGREGAEAAMGAAFAPFGDIQVYAGDEATEKRVVEDVPGGAVLHVVCDAYLRPEDALLGGLLLKPEAGDDGQLAAADLLAADIPARLAVLDVVDAQAQPQERALVLGAFAETLMHAGVPSLITTRWAVDLDESAALFKSFYAALETMGNAKALAEAKRVFRAENPESLTWAAFALSGDYR